jgi:hypothetical protein
MTPTPGEIACWRRHVNNPHPDIAKAARDLLAEHQEEQMADKPEWKDATNYTRDKPRGETPITAWEIERGSMRIYLTCAHFHAPGSWVMHCRAVGLDTHDTGLPSTADAADAKIRAIGIVERMLARQSADLALIKGVM